MKGKDKCKILKEIRKQIAEENEIEWVTEECRHKGECKGTCPRCESEVRKLERELEMRRRIGKTVALVGLSALCVTGLAACGPSGLGQGGPEPDDLMGAIDIVETVPPETNPDDIMILDGEIALPEMQENDTDVPGDEIIPADDFELSGDVWVES